MANREQERLSPIDYLKMLRDEYSNEIPDQILHGPVSVTNPKRNKARRNWWFCVVGRLDKLRSKNLVPFGLDEEVNDFIKHYSSKEFHNQLLTTEADINKANELITKIVGK